MKKITTVLLLLICQQPFAQKIFKGTIEYQMKDYKQRGLGKNKDSRVVFYYGSQFIKGVPEPGTDPDDNQETMLYDFAAARVYTINEHKKKYSEMNPDEMAMFDKYFKLVKTDSTRVLFGYTCTGYKATFDMGNANSNTFFMWLANDLVTDCRELENPGLMFTIFASHHVMLGMDIYEGQQRQAAFIAEKLIPGNPPDSLFSLDGYIKNTVPDTETLPSASEGTPTESLSDTAMLVAVDSAVASLRASAKRTSTRKKTSGKTTIGKKPNTQRTPARKPKKIG
jgi:hypothetical protein